MGQERKDSEEWAREGGKGEEASGRIEGEGGYGGRKGRKEKGERAREEEKGRGK
jgi:hypothetical protein